MTDLPDANERSMQAEHRLCVHEGTEAAGRRGTELARMVSELLEPTGHRVRMRLLFCAARQAPRPETSLVEHAAFAVELLHIASLIHDDVIDCAQLRRSAPTAVARWGNRGATLVGGAILTRAVRHIALCGGDAVHLFMQAAIDMCDGGLCELLRARDVGQDETQYLATVEMKTASLLATAGYLGADLAYAGERERRAATRFGYALGVAWQIWDDVIDLAATPASTGKSASDLSGGIITLPVILALEVDDALRRDFAVACAGGDNLEQFRDRILNTDGPGRAVAVAERYAERAAAALDNLPEPDELHVLLAETRERHRELPAPITPVTDGVSMSPRLDPFEHGGRRPLDDYVAASSSPNVARMLALAGRIDSSSQSTGAVGEMAERDSALELIDATADVMARLPVDSATKDDSIALLAADRALTFALHLYAGSELRELVAIAEQAEVAFERALDS